MEIGAFRPANRVFCLDCNGNGVWDADGVMNALLPPGARNVGEFATLDAAFADDYA
jgi:hypothetical protein